MKQTGDMLLLKNRSVQVFVNLKNGKVSFRELKGKLLLTEKENGDIVYVSTMPVSILIVYPNHLLR